MSFRTLSPQTSLQSKLFCSVILSLYLVLGKSHQSFLQKISPISLTFVDTSTCVLYIFFLYFLYLYPSWCFWESFSTQSFQLTNLFNFVYFAITSSYWMFISMQYLCMQFFKFLKSFIFSLLYEFIHFAYFTLGSINSVYLLYLFEIPVPSVFIIYRLFYSLYLNFIDSPV